VNSSNPILVLTGRSATLPVVGSRCVGYDNAQATVAGQLVKGVAQSPQIAGRDYPIVVIGAQEIESGAAFAVGAALMTDATGRVITQTASNYIVGYALEAATAAGQAIEVLLAM
jgi:Uncharacterized conserved protein (DUF2190)